MQLEYYISHAVIAFKLRIGSVTLPLWQCNCFISANANEEQKWGFWRDWRHKLIAPARPLAVLVHPARMYFWGGYYYTPWSTYISIQLIGLTRPANIRV